MSDSSRKLMINECEPMQTEPILLSSDEDSTSEHPMCDQCLPAHDDAQFQPLNHFVIHLDDPADAQHVTTSSWDIEMIPLSSSAEAKLKLQSNKHRPANLLNPGPSYWIPTTITRDRLTRITNAVHERFIFCKTCRSWLYMLLQT